MTINVADLLSEARQIRKLHDAACQRHAHSDVCSYRMQTYHSDLDEVVRAAKHNRRLLSNVRTIGTDLYVEFGDVLILHTALGK